MTILSTILSTVLMLIVISIFVAFILISHAIRTSGNSSQSRVAQKVRNQVDSPEKVTQRRG